MSEIFCLDANSFIEPYRRFYAFDIAPDFWNWLISKAYEGKVCSTMAVYIELKQKEDKLYEWASAHKNILFKEPDQRVYRVYESIANYVKRRYTIKHYEKFLSGADPWVIAHSKAYNWVVVTMEARRGEQIDRTSGKIVSEIKIPNVCEAFGVKYVNLFDMLRSLKLQFRI